MKASRWSARPDGDPDIRPPATYVDRSYCFGLLVFISHQVFCQRQNNGERCMPAERIESTKNSMGCRFFLCSKACIPVVWCRPGLAILLLETREVLNYLLLWGTLRRLAIDISPCTMVGVMVLTTPDHRSYPEAYHALRSNPSEQLSFRHRQRGYHAAGWYLSPHVGCRGTRSGDRCASSTHRHGTLDAGIGIVRRRRLFSSIGGTGPLLVVG